MRGRTASLSACLLTVLAALCVPLASGAGSPKANALRQENAALAARSRSAVLGLYALDSRLARVRSELGALRVRADRLGAQRTIVRKEVTVARGSLAASELQLAERLRAIYERGDVDPVAVILGATSLDGAIATLDALSRSAQENQDVIRETLAARHRLRALSHALAARQAEVERATAAAAASLDQLSATRSARTAYLARVAQQRQLNTREIRVLQQEAAAAQAKAATVNAAAAATPPPAADASAPAPAATTPTPVGGGRTLTVGATGYSLDGRTATGVPVGWGVVAVDPSVIPLGSHMTIPGYGEGIAADTGSAVQGAAIDLWFPTLAQARAWGRRVVTITLH